MGASWEIRANRSQETIEYGFDGQDGLCNLFHKEVGREYLFENNVSNTSAFFHVSALISEVQRRLAFSLLLAPIFPPLLPARFPRDLRTRRLCSLHADMFDFIPELCFVLNETQAYQRLPRASSK
jgi:hypothetical protein